MCEATKKDRQYNTKVCKNYVKIDCHRVSKVNNSRVFGQTDLFSCKSHLKMWFYTLSSYTHMCALPNV